MKNKKGFTLTELVSVVLILGILGSIAIPKYMKTMENSKASAGISTGYMIYSANAVYEIDHPTALLSGNITNTCNSGACNTADLSGCRLVRCKYMAADSWDTKPYIYTVGAAGGIMNVTAARRTSGASGTSTTPYSTWGYTFQASACAPLNGAPDCPAL